MRASLKVDTLARFASGILVGRNILGQFGKFLVELVLVIGALGLLNLEDQAEELKLEDLVLDFAGERQKLVSYILYINKTEGSVSSTVEFANVYLPDLKSRTLFGVLATSGVDGIVEATTLRLGILGGLTSGLEDCKIVLTNGR